AVDVGESPREPARPAALARRNERALRVSTRRVFDPAEPRGNVGEARDEETRADDGDSFVAHRAAPIRTLTLFPPKAKELLRTRRSRPSRRSVTTDSSSAGSRGSARSEAGMNPSRIASADIAASVAPAAPSMWPV